MSVTTKGLVLTGGKNKTLKIKNIELPDLCEGHALIRIKAAALNHRDKWMVEGKYPDILNDTILGSDGCGVVEKVNAPGYDQWLSKKVVINPNNNWGSDEKAQSNKYHILGMPSHGTFGNLLMVPADRLHLKPAHLTDEQAAALPLGGLTAYRAVIVQGEAGPGQKVLVTGAGGGVAQFAFQFALATGSETFVTSGSDEKINNAKNSGISGGVNYKEEDWEQKFKQTAGNFDLIIDSAGGDAWNKLIRLLKPGGRLVFYGATRGIPSSLHLHRIFWRQLRIQGTTMGSDNDFLNMLKFVSDNRIVPVIDATFPFREISAAFDRMRAPDHFGKLVVKM